MRGLLEVYERGFVRRRNGLEKGINSLIKLRGDGFYSCKEKQFFTIIRE